MKGQRPPITIPIVDAASARIAGGFCASREAVTADELTALHHLRTLRAEAETIKTRLAETLDAPTRDTLQQRLDTLRQEANHWRTVRSQATLDKHIALGHATLPVLSLDSH
ncbi:MAG: hypothetical protein H7833_12275 [Magnetococcus sp. DMHC-1]|nr:hypothetical protein [Magnetococcales bacterium]